MSPRPRAGEASGSGPSPFVVVAAGFIGTWRWFAQTDDSAAFAIPAEMDLYVGVDALQVLSGDVSDLFDTVSESVRLISGEDSGDATEAFEGLRRELVEMLGLEEGEDPLAWVGRTAAIAADLDGLTTDIENLDPFGQQPDVLLVIESRDQAAALRTVEALIDDAIEQGESFTRGEFSDLPFWTYVDSISDEVWAVAVTDDMVVAGTNDAVIDSLEMESGQSLAEAADYQEVVGQLSEGRLMTGFFRLDPDLFADVEGFEDIEGQLGPFFTVSTSAFGMTIEDDSIRFESVSPVPEDPDALALFAVEGSFADQLGADTLAFFEMPPVKDMYEVFQPLITAAEGEEVVDELRQESLDQLGFDVFDDFILLLDGASGFALTSDPSSPLDPSIPLSGLLAFGSSETDTLADNLDKIYESAIRDGFPIFERDGRYYVEDLGSVPAVYGIEDGWLTLALTETDYESFTDTLEPFD